MLLPIRPTGQFWIVQLVAITLFALFVTLGSWQLGRGDVKSEIEHAVSDQDEVFEAIRLPLVEIEKWRYKKIKLIGQYDTKKQFLFDNQVRGGITGYNVLTPFYVVQFNAWVLVDRGWLPQGESRDHLPDIEFQSNETSIAGRIYVPYDQAYSLGGIAEGEDSGWPRRIQFVDYQQLSSRYDQTLQPFTLRLNEQQPNGYRRDWAETNLTAKKHYGYAFQWYAMALALAVIWWLYSIKPLFKKNEN
ncbi:MAG: SURF1 family protein [Gammaproteobacteria bacterium]|nr:SURF1 family protein [Gammaproteobacteria bacterium]